MKMSTLEKPSQSNLLETPSSLMDNIQAEAFKRGLLWHGIFITTLGFLLGLCIPLYANPRAGLAAHALAVTQGMFLAIIGFAYPQLNLSFWMARASYWMFLISAYTGVLSQVLGAAFELTRVFPVTAKGLPEGISWLETAVEIPTKAITLFILLACFIVLFGLRGTKADAKE
jgi:hydroxylaminobenzene mutase